MSDYFGSATLEDWLAEEVFHVDCGSIPSTVITLFEEWRESIEHNIENWMDSDGGDGHPVSWRNWGRGFNVFALDDESYSKFEAAVEKGKKLLKAPTVAMQPSKPTVDQRDLENLLSTASVEEKVFFGKTLCVCYKLPNGFTVTGTASCTHPENFVMAVGRDMCRDHALKQLWELETYRLLTAGHQQAASSAPL